MEEDEGWENRCRKRVVRVSGGERGEGGERGRFRGGGRVSGVGIGKQKEEEDMQGGGRGFSV